MRNLVLASQRCHPPKLDLSNVALIATDPDTDTIFGASPDGWVFAWNGAKGDWMAEAHIDWFYPPAGTTPDPQRTPVDLDRGAVAAAGAAGGAPVCLTYLPDAGLLFLALASGSIYTCNPEMQVWDAVGAVDDGLLGACWSPDHELLVLTTGASKVILMTREYDVVAESPILTDDFGEAKPVAVGWGSTDTQFGGTAGKAAVRKVTEAAQKAAIDAVTGSDKDVTAFTDDALARVSWRADGQFFVVSIKAPAASHKRILRVYNRAGVLQSTSEEVAGLEHAVSWRPSGNLIASSQRLPHRHDIVFFERNGLRHGEFTLPFGRDQVVVRELAWNADSSVLAVWLEATPIVLARLVKTASSVSNTASASKSAAAVGAAASQNKQRDAPLSCLQLWTVGNYHWYLKQEYTFGAESNGPDTRSGYISSVVWDTEDPLTVHVMCDDGQYLRMSHVTDIAISVGPRHVAASSASPTAAKHMSTVAVCDGSDLLLSHFQKMIVPPPMSSSKLPLSTCARAVSFAPDGSGRIAVLRGDGTVALFHASSPTALAAAPTLAGELAVHDIKKHASELGMHAPVRLLTWWQADLLVFVRAGTNPIAETLVAVKFDPTTYTISSVHELTLPAAQVIVRLAVDPTSGRLFVASDNGHYEEVTYSVDSGLQVTTLPFRSPTCHWVAPTTVGPDNTLLVISQSKSMGLFVNGFKLAASCNSFALHEEFVVFACSDHACRFVALSDLARIVTSGAPAVDISARLAALVHAATAASSGDHSVRRVERGSKIVAVIANDMRVVFQMPRGNLETVAPRMLALSTLRQYLDQHRYRDALEMMRKHRIDMNFAYDHNPSEFMASIDEFVRQVNHTTMINLFLTELRDEDTVISMYNTSATTAAAAAVQQADAAAQVSEYEQQQMRLRSAAVPGKTNKICDAVHAALKRLDPDKFLLSCFTALARKSPPQLETILETIKTMCASEAAKSTVQPSTPKTSSAAEALAFVIFLADVNLLFDVALGMYDFELTIVIAEQSQKDPKEYLPFIHSLQALDTHMQRFTIDRHLKRFDKAVQSLVRASAEPAVSVEERTKRASEVMPFVRKHALYRTCLAIFDLGDATHSTSALSARIGEYSRRQWLYAALDAYADYLQTQDQHEEAGLLFTRATRHSKAAHAFRKCRNWRRLFVALDRVNQQRQASVEGSPFVTEFGADRELMLFDPTERDLLELDDEHWTAHYETVAVDMARSLTERALPREAVQVLLYHTPGVNRVEDAIQILIRAQLWEDATLACYQWKRQDLIETNLEPHVEEMHDLHSTTIATLKEDIAKHTSRLLIVREQKRAAAAANVSDLGMDGEGVADDSDLYSDTTSVASMATSRSGRSASSRTSMTSTRQTGKKSQKAHNKKLRLREGSLHEEEALMEALREAIARGDAMQEEIRDLLRILVSLGRQAAASKLQESYSALLSIMRTNHPIIWPAAALSAQTAPTGPALSTAQMISLLTQQATLAASSSASSSTAAGPSASSSMVAAPVLRTLSWQMSLF
ncbi:hypothetical protein CAOG_09002 [Capsaspora owczarzaki ATCC 30864]|uniref:Elongator complex protein 1 n=1 Tax=Capsaspora owczarzaki (strain ATCC 30864) TaxID=595528 RepID=A0A0D2X4P2_CAPO3|nr:hypothetical protein CAOG_09002 [Capsaspora owczarzaki ATCC 30864]KJE96404.1 hypothetical protein CAOG_009002 [Capsaspora owczarzaki ATCC 30864]|eukprot:XP_011270689.1 hypothetical protein CAOG_09002 [Capsaspora owczarzaki ATCC 30864]